MGIMEVPPKRERENDMLDILFSIISIALLALGLWKAVEIAHFFSEYVTISIEVSE